MKEIVRGMVPHVSEILAYVPPQGGVIHTTTTRVKTNRGGDPVKSDSCHCLAARSTDDGKIAGLLACDASSDRAVDGAFSPQRK